MGKVTIFACGGTGVNIAKRIGDLDIDVVFVDTSVSNMKTIKSDNVFLVEGMDGAGKLMSATYEEFKPIVTDVLMKFPPSKNLNIVVGSMSGGSGAVIAPLLASQLVDEGYNTLAIGVISDHSTTEINNALRSLRSYRGRSNVLKKPISLFPIHGVRRSEADQTVLHFISLLSLLVDKKHTAEFDTADLRSFLFFDRVTDNAPTVAIIELMSNEAFVPEKGTSVVGSVLLTKDQSSTIYPAYPEYMGTCLVTDPDYTNSDIRINSVLGKFSLLVEHLETKLKTQSDQKHLNKVRDVTVSPTQDDGMCL
ncbi:hypothetical protein [Flavobacterium sp.]|jgi:hypothetical protein|uniref:hypothetical protein n=1 Tax=Flavobacterium sp. TaxID=239 RepID=UPI0037BEB872